MISKNLKDKISLAINSSAGFLYEESNNQFSEAIHIMKFPFWINLKYINKKHYGEVFHLATILTSLLKAREAGYGNNATNISYFVNRIICLKNSKNGWKYFPELNELPPDNDDLAQIIQLFHVYDPGLIHKFCKDAVESSLKLSLNHEGLIRTWILDWNKKDRENIVYRYNVRKRWGDSLDCEVVANLLYSLYLFDYEYYKELISGNIKYIARSVNSEGYWDSTWYWGKFYGTYVCIRILSLISPGDIVLKKATNFLYENRNLDYGFGIPGSNPLDSSFSLLSLFCLQKIMQVDESLIEKGIEYLLETHDSTGSWSSTPYIKMCINPNTKGEKRYLSYESRTITTAYCLQALLASLDFCHNYKV